MGMETLLLASTAAATIMTASSQYVSGQDAEKTYGYNAKLAERNAEISRQQAELIGREGAQEQYQLGQEYAHLKGTQEANYSKSGVTFEGTPAAVMLQSGKNYELDLLTSKYNTQIGQNRALTAADYAMSQAEYDRYLGRQAKTQSQTKAALSLLTGGITASKYIPGVSGYKITSRNDYQDTSQFFNQSLEY